MSSTGRRVGQFDPSLRQRAYAVQPQGEQDSFQSFYEHEYGDLFSAMWLVSRDRHDAEELTQEAFLRVWERWERLRNEPGKDTYLYRTAMNLFRSRLRRARVAMRHVLQPPNSTDALQAVEDRDDLVRRLRDLSPRQRAALVLTEVLGFPASDAGFVLGIRASTVRVLAKNGRDRLRERWSPDA